MSMNDVNILHLIGDRLTRAAPFPFSPTAPTRGYSSFGDRTDADAIYLSRQCASVRIRDTFWPTSAAAWHLKASRLRLNIITRGTRAAGQHGLGRRITQSRVEDNRPAEHAVTHDQD